jgi:hypothetical protein
VAKVIDVCTGQRGADSSHSLGQFIFRKVCEVEANVGDRLTVEGVAATGEKICAG